ncbi:MAG: 2-polyprenyl-3-methyl-6-methoxy-1,4-benzoquinone monooxygenase [Burkholderiaceae bacterium]
MNKQSTLDSTPVFSRRIGVLDRLLSEVGRAVQVLDGSVHAGRPNPAGKPPAQADEPQALSSAERQHAAGLMRVNHVGEICAQALYRGQALFCRDASIRQVLHSAAAEEVDHLVWCRDRLHELQSRPSLFNPLWYAGSFSLGVLAGRAGVGKNLGFMAETEKQVEQHLDRHLTELPLADTRSRAIVTQMRDDEIGHRNTAETHGAHKLPKPVQLAMKAMSKVMTTTAYRI